MTCQPTPDPDVNAMWRTFDAEDFLTAEAKIVGRTNDSAEDES